jgi:hypothetical protein
MPGSLRSSSRLRRLLALPLEHLQRLPDAVWESLSPEEARRLSEHLDQLDPARAERLDAVMQSRDVVLSEVGGALAAYDKMLGADDFGAAPHWLERLAASWREVCERQKLEQLGERLLPDEAVQLVGALQSSLVLCRDTYQQLALDAGELLARTRWLAATYNLGARFSDAVAPLTAGARGAVTPPRRPHRTVAGRAEELAGLIARAMEPAAALYGELRPDGRPLASADAARARQCLADIATCGRALDRQRLELSEPDWTVARLLAGELHAAERSLVLALSDDRKRRALAMSEPERQARAFLVCELAAGGTRRDAYAKLAGTR